MTLAPFNQTLGVALGVTLMLATTALRFVVARRIVVTDTSLELGRATLPLGILGKAELIAKDEQFFARGALADPHAFFMLKSGLPDLVRIQIADPSDPTPYALVSCRKGAELVEVLREVAGAKHRAKRADAGKGK